MAKILFSTFSCASKAFATIKFCPVNPVLSKETTIGASQKCCS